MLQKDLVDKHEENKLQLRQLENMNEIRVFDNHYIYKFHKLDTLLYHIKCLNPHKEEEPFKNRLKEIISINRRQRNEMFHLVIAKEREVVKGLSPVRIQQFLQFEADESHIEDQCQVCLEEFEVGRLMKQLDCGGRHLFCSVCIDQWFANHKTCPICRHNFA